MRLHYVTPQFTDLSEFVDYWASTYQYKYEELYTKNIMFYLTENRVLKLYKWKNGGPISKEKVNSIIENYVKPLNTNFQVEDYVSIVDRPGGAIWNIFFAHINRPRDYPLFDQHVYRAAYYMTNGEIPEDLKTNKQKYQVYNDWYRPVFIQECHKQLDVRDPIRWTQEYVNRLRELDKALFQFGRLLKAIKKITKDGGGTYANGYEV